MATLNTLNLNIAFDMLNGFQNKQMNYNLLIFI